MKKAAPLLTANGLDKSDISRAMMANQADNRQLKVEQAMGIYAQLDICFCCDVTGSMDYYINTVQVTLNSIVAKIKPELHVLPRLAFVGYRDKKDKQPLEMLDFTESVETMQAHIKSIKCEGGDDQAEDVVAALIRATQLNWRSRNKILILVMDAPTHGKRYHDGVLDDYKDDDKRELNLERMCDYFSEANVCLIVFKCNSSVDKMVQIMQLHYKPYDLSTRTYSLEAAYKEGIKTLEREFAKLCTESISSTYRRGQNPTKISDTHSDDSISEWNPTMFKQKYPFRLFSGKISKLLMTSERPSLAIYVQPRSDIVLSLGVDEVASGAMRKCFQVEHDNEKYLMKIPKVAGEYSSWRDVEGEVAVMLVASHYAQKFNESLRDPTQVLFLSGYACEVLKNDRLFNRNKFVMIEQFMNGRYVKYNNNSGWVNPKDQGTDHYNLIQAFSHFTYCDSNKVLLITDLQGTFQGKQIHLTDPAIHSEEFRDFFGTTNVGYQGMAKFFLSHKCNSYCRKLGLTAPQLREPAPKSLSTASTQQRKEYWAENLPDLQKWAKRAQEADRSAVEQAKTFAQCDHRRRQDGEDRKNEEDKKGAKDKEDDPPSFSIKMNGQPPRHKEEEEWLSQFCEYHDFKNIVNTRTGRPKTSVLVWLEDPSQAPIVVNQNKHILFQGKPVELFLWDAHYKEHRAAAAMARVDPHLGLILRDSTIPVEDLETTLRMCFAFEKIHVFTNYRKKPPTRTAQIWLKDPSKQADIVAKHRIITIRDEMFKLYVWVPKVKHSRRGEKEEDCHPRPKSARVALSNPRFPLPASPQIA